MTVTARAMPLPDEAAVGALAAVMARFLPAPFVIYLSGDLGSGKTTFARALIGALGFGGRVKSPTYGLLETYTVPGRTILHLDLYRIERPADLEYLAIRDLFGADDLLLVEWPERAAGRLPPADLEMRFEYAGTGRSLELEPRSCHARELLEQLRAG